MKPTDSWMMNYSESFLHNKVKLSLLWERRDSLFAILCDSGDLFFV